MSERIPMHMVLHNNTFLRLTQAVHKLGDNRPRKGMEWICKLDFNHCASTSRLHAYLLVQLLLDAAAMP